MKMNLSSSILSIAIFLSRSITLVPYTGAFTSSFTRNKLIRPFRTEEFEKNMPNNSQHYHTQTQQMKGSSSSATTSFLSTTSASSLNPETETLLHHVSGLQEIVDKFDIFLLDMWGVMHDGKKPYEHVLDTVQNLKKSNKKMIILSNSSKRISNATKMLKKLGFDVDDFQSIITSGEVSHRMLSGDLSLQCKSWNVLTSIHQARSKSDLKKAFVFGSGDGDAEYCLSAGWTPSPISEADLIIARGTFTIFQSEGDSNNDSDFVWISKEAQGEQCYQNVLEETLRIAAKRKVPMLVTNPDRVRPDADLSPMPGAIADQYENILTEIHGPDENAIKEILGEDGRDLVRRIGKPYGEVYDLAFATCIDDDINKDNFEPSAGIMVGDALETDVKGGLEAKCSTLWVVNDGIHSKAVLDESGPDNEDSTSFQKGTQIVVTNYNDSRDLFNENRVVPKYVIPHFQW